MTVAPTPPEQTLAYFPRGESYANVGTSDDLSFPGTTSFTIAAVIAPYATTEAAICARGTQYQFLYVASGSISILRDGDTSALQSTGVLPYFQFTHVAVTYGYDVIAQTGTLSLYINGVLDSSQASPGVAGAFDGATTTLGGGDSSDNFDMFFGAVKHVAMWKTALDAAAIQQIVFATPQPQKDMVALFDFSVYQNGQWGDTSGHGHPVNIVGTTWWMTTATPGIELMGDGGVSCSSSSLIASGNHTIEVWFCATGASESVPSSGLVMTGNNSNTYLMISNNHITGCIGGTFVYGNTQLTQNVWYHAAMTYDGSTAVLYLNGSVDQSLRLSNAVWDVSGQVIKIGSAPYLGKTVLFQGWIQEVRFWNCARSALDIAFFVSGIPVGEPDLAVYISFTGGTASDLLCVVESINYPSDVYWLQLAYTRLSPLDPHGFAREYARLRGEAPRLPRPSPPAKVFFPTNEIECASLTAFAILAAYGINPPQTAQTYSVLVTASAHLGVRFSLSQFESDATLANLEQYVVTLAGAGLFKTLVMAFSGGVNAEAVVRLLGTIGKLTIGTLPESVQTAVSSLLLILHESATALPEQRAVGVTMFQANGGDCFMVQVVTEKRGESRIISNMLIDGGPAVAFNAIKRQLPTHFQEVVVTHIDDDHISGIVAMVQDPSFTIDAFSFDSPWTILDQPSNGVAAEPVKEAAEIVARSDLDPIIEALRNANNLTWYAQEHRPQAIPIYPPVRGDFSKFGYLYTTFHGPSQANLNALVVDAAPHLSSPAGVHIDAHIVNRASIIHRMYSTKDNIELLFTGDAWDTTTPNRPDIRQGLGILPPPPAGYVTRRVTMMKVPHHGSDVSCDANFYASVLADIYLVSAKNGGHPTFDTLAAIVQANVNSHHPFNIYVTNNVNGVPLLALSPTFSPSSTRLYRLYCLKADAIRMDFVSVNGSPFQLPTVVQVDDLDPWT
jgi:hypothetical protein